MSDALQMAIAERFPRALIADRDERFAYLALAGQRGVTRVAHVTLPHGGIALGKPEPMRPRSQPAKGKSMSSQDARDAQITALNHRVNEMLLMLGTRPERPDVESADYAALAAPPDAWGGWGDKPVPYRPPAPMDPAYDGIRLHNLAVLGGADDYSPVVFDDRPAADDADRDFTPCKALWD